MKIAGFPAAARGMIKDRLNAIALPPAEDFRTDSDLFLKAGQDPETQRRVKLSMERGFQTREWEMDLAGQLPTLGK